MIHVMPVTVCVHVHVRQTPQVVTEAFVNPENAVHWTKDLERFEVVSGGPGEAGAHARLHYRQSGRAYVMDDVLEHVEPGRLYVSRVSGEALEARVETRISQRDGGTDLDFRWSATGRTWFMRGMLWIMRPVMARGIRRELEVFARLVEERGARFG